MDILYWNNLNPQIKFNHTVKQFYNQYLWRMIVQAPGGKLLYSKNPDLGQALEHRKNLSRLYNHGGSWSQGNSIKLDLVDLNLLDSIRTIKIARADQIKIRIEEPNIQFYAKDESTLKSVAQQLNSVDSIKNITGPADNTEVILESGAIIRRTPVTYPYKIILRDGRYSPQVKQQLLNYLDALGDTVKLSKTCRDMLSRSHPSLWSVFFYTNDDKVATFISLIDPNLISNIHHVVNVDR